jgi:hypothetical protein
MNLYEVAQEILAAHFHIRPQRGRAASGCTETRRSSRRPALARDHILFYEYFHTARTAGPRATEGMERLPWPA